MPSIIMAFFNHAAGTQYISRWQKEVIQNPQNRCIVQVVKIYHDNNIWDYMIGFTIEGLKFLLYSFIYTNDIKDKIEISQKLLVIKSK